MIQRDLKLIVQSTKCTLNNPVTLYRYDRGIRLNIEIVKYDYTFDGVIESNILLKNHICKTQVILLSPKGEIWEEPIIDSYIEEDRVNVDFKDVMLDESMEVGEYLIQIHLFDENDSRITLYPFSIQVEDLIGYADDIEFDAGDKGEVDIPEIVPDGVLSSDWFNMIEEKLQYVWSKEFYKEKEREELETDNKTVIDAINELVNKYNILLEKYNNLKSIKNGSSAQSVVAMQSMSNENNFFSIKSTKEITSINVLNKLDNKFDVGEYKLYRFTTNLMSIFEKYQVRFKSENPNIAKCNSTGKVLGVNRGETYIVAYNKNNPSVKDRFKVIIGPYKAATSLVFNEVRKTVAVGDTFTIGYKINPYDATTTDVTWSVIGNNGNLSSNGKGAFTALKPGVVYIQGTLPTGVSCKCKVTIAGETEEVITGIVIRPSSFSLYVDRYYNLKCYTVPGNKDITNVVSWKSSDNTVAKVDGNGLLTSLKKGRTAITASYLGSKYSDSITVDVTEYVPEYVCTAVSITGASKVIVGRTIQLDYTWEPTDIPKPYVVWTSSNPSVATVDSYGKVTALKEGTTTIKCAYSSTVYDEKVITAVPKLKLVFVADPYIDGNDDKPAYIYVNKQTVYLRDIPHDGNTYTYEYDDTVKSIKFSYASDSFSPSVNSYRTCNLKEVKEIDTYYLTDMTYMFQNAEVTTLPELDFSSAESIKGLFAFCTKLTSLQNKIILNENISSLRYLYYGCRSLTNFPTIDTSNITDMKGMFGECFLLVRDNIPNLNTSKVTNMSGMFKNCTSLTTIPQLDTSNVTDMSEMFHSYYNEHRLVSIPELNTSRVTNMERMFSGCKSLTTLPQQLDTSKVTNMKYMFEGCNSLTTLPQLDTSNVVDMNSMFSWCTSITTITQQLDTSKVTDMSSMFNNCTSLNTIPQLDTSNVTTMYGIFKNCTSMTGYAEPSKYWKKGNVTSHEEAFYNCNKLDNYKYIPLDWGGFGLSEDENILIIKTNTTDLTRTIAFSYTSNDTIDYSLKLSSMEKIGDNTYKTGFSKKPTLYKFYCDPTEIVQIETSNVTNANRMFFACDSLISVCDLNLEKANNIDYMFNGCHNLNTIGELRNTSNVTSAESTFSGCSSLTTIPNLDTTNITNMNQMFHGCENMTGTADPNKYWLKGNVVYYNNTFTNCNSLTNYSDIPSEWK